MTGPSKGDRTRRRLLDAAAAEIARHGPDATSLAGVARRAGLQPGSVYFHFSSRDALVEAVHEEGLRESLRILETALAAVPEGGGPAVRLRTAMRAHLEALSVLSDYAAVVLAPALVPARTTMPSYDDLFRSYLDRWTGLVVAAQRAGTLPPGPDPREVRDLIIGALNAAGLAGRPREGTARTLGLLIGIEPDPAEPATGRPRAP